VYTPFLGHLLALIFVYHSSLAQQCPTELLSIANKTFTVPLRSPVTFKLCDTLENGCAVPGGGQICAGPGCSSVCQSWGGENPGAASLGKFSSFTKNATTIILIHTGGDPVYPPGPPDPGPRETFIFIHCGGSEPVGEWQFVDALDLPRDGAAYQYWLITTSSLCGSGSDKLDPGYPVSIAFPGYLLLTNEPIHKGAAVTLLQPKLSYRLNVSVACGQDSNCLFQVFVLDNTNMQNFLANKPFVCKNAVCNQRWAQIVLGLDLVADGFNVHVVVVPQVPTTLSILVAGTTIGAGEIDLTVAKLS